MNLRRSIFLLLFALALQQGVAQVWNKVGSGLDYGGSLNPTPVSVEDNGNLYVAYLDTNSNLAVSKWNGLSWSLFPTVNLQAQAPKLYDIEVAPGGDIYVSYSSGIDTGNVYRFNGTNWSKLFAQDFSGSIRDLLYANGQLYMGGPFSSGAPSLTNVAAYNGTSFTDLFSSSLLGFDTIVALSFLNAELYASGTFGNLTSGDTIPVRVRRNNNWEVPASMFIGFSKISSLGVSFFEESGSFWLLAKERSLGPGLTLYEIDGDSIFFRDSLSISLGSHPLIGQARLGAERFFSFSNSGISEVFQVDNGTINRLSNLPALIGHISGSSNELFLLARDTAFDPQLYPHPYNYAYSTNTGFARMSGQVFLDRNGNCILDPGEEHLPASLLGLSQGGTSLHTTSNISGNYSFLIPAGVYSFDSPLSISRLYKRLHSTCNLPSSIALSANQQLQQNIALEHDGDIDALIDGSSYAGVALYGFTQNYQVAIQNPGIDISGLVNVEFTLPPTMTFVSAVPPPTSVAGNTYSFNFNGLAMFEEKTIELQLRTDTAGNKLGDTLSLVSLLNGINGDVDLSNNTDTLKLEVRGAFDPNDKTPSATQIKPGTSRIDYRIRFQNTGNAPAVKVTVVDTLDLTLPVTAIIMNSASHAYSISAQNNILIWEFNDIMLPDSAIDSLGSQGFISFSAGLNPSLGIGDTIDNDAEIYFDYQKPIHTNHAKTAIVKNVSLVENALQQWVEVYPNPARDRLYIKWKGTGKATFTLFDVNGKPVKAFEIKEHEKDHLLEIERLPRGIYFIRSERSAHKIVIR